MHFRNKLKEIFSNNSVLKSLKLFASKFKNVWSEYKIWKWIQILYFVILTSYAPQTIITTEASSICFHHMMPG